ncbi:MAG: hypothetical protein V1848_02655 [Candidatus Magasanikbacteria bacterium]
MEIKKVFIGFIVFIIAIILGFFIFSFIERAQIHAVGEDISFGFLPADNLVNYKEMKEVGISYVMISSFSEQEAEARINEAGKQGMKVYLSAGTLHPDDYKRVELFGGREEVEGFFLDEPHVHKANYTNTDLEHWLDWSKEKFPNKKLFIATPRMGTYQELIDISNLHLAGFQPDTYPIYGIVKLYRAQRKLVEKMEGDGFEVQPIIQSHFYEGGPWQSYIDVFARLNSGGLTTWPTTQDVVKQIQNVTTEKTKLIWFYPGENTYISWTPERKKYFKEIFSELKKSGEYTK